MNNLLKRFFVETKFSDSYRELIENDVLGDSVKSYQYRRDARFRSLKTCEEPFLTFIKKLYSFDLNDIKITYSDNGDKLFEVEGLDPKLKDLYTIKFRGIFVLTNNESSQWLSSREKRCLSYILAEIQNELRDNIRKIKRKEVLELLITS